MTTPSIKLIDGGILVIAQNTYEETYLTAGSVTGFAGPSVLDVFDIYMSNGQTKQVRVKGVEPIKNAKDTLLQFLKTPPPINPAFEEEMIFIHTRIDSLHDKHDKAVENNNTDFVKLEGRLNDYEDKCEALVQPHTYDDWLVGAIVVLVAMVVFQLMYIWCSLKNRL